MIGALELLGRAIAIGSTAAGAVHAIRTLPPVARLVERGVKPWACDVCSAFWLTVFVGAPLGLLDLWWWFATPPAYALALWLTRFLGAPQGLPPPPEE